MKWDWVVTRDAATNEHDSMRFVDEDGTASRLLGVRDVIEPCGLFASLSTDRGSHDWHTPVAGGQGDRETLIPFGTAMARLGIEMIPASSPEARGRSDRMFRTHQGRLPQERAAARRTDRAAATRDLAEVYRPALHAGFMPPATAEGSVFVAWIGGDRDDFTVRALRARRGQGQRRVLRGDGRADSQGSPPDALREGQGAGA